MVAPPVPPTPDRPSPTPDNWGPAPRDDGFAYPGTWPDRSILLGTDQHWPLDIEPDCPLGQARVSDFTILDTAHTTTGDTTARDTTASPTASNRTTTLDRALTALGRPPMAARFPVLAVGSNAAPAQVRHKFHHPRSPVMPLVEVTVTGMDVAAAAQVAPYGAVPATPVFGHDLSCRLFVAWLDTHQLSHMDATEGVASVRADVGYERWHLTSPGPDHAPYLDLAPGPDHASCLDLAPGPDLAPGLDADPRPDTGSHTNSHSHSDSGRQPRPAVRVRLSDGRHLSACFAYVARGGHLADPAVPPSAPARPLLLFTAQNRDQRALLARLLGASPGLRAALGDTPERWVATVLADPAAAQDAVSRALRTEHRVIAPASADTAR